MSSVTALKILTEDALSNLEKRAVEFHGDGKGPDIYLDYVIGPQLLGSSSFQMQSKLKVTDAPKLSAMASSSQDWAASIAVFEWLGEIDLVAAQDRRLWTTLAFNEFRDYMSVRWSLSSEADWTGRVCGARTARWVLGSPTREKLARHGIARLWWAAYLTHDPDFRGDLSRKSGDEWAYLKLMFDKADRFLALSERQISSIRPVLFGMLDAIADDDSRKTEAFVRGFAKDVDLVAGYTELGLLDFPEAKALVCSLHI
jgi:hypothetical protein